MCMLLLLVVSGQCLKNKTEILYEAQVHIMQTSLQQCLAAIRTVENRHHHDMLMVSQTVKRSIYSNNYPEVLYLLTLPDLVL